VSLYDTLLFAHILAAAVWVGGGIVLLVLGTRLARVSDHAGLKSVFDQSSWLSQRIFTPVALLVLLLGILLVLEGPWSFGDLWVVLGLVGFALTFLTGLFVLMPQANRVDASLRAHGGMNDEAAEGIRRLFTLMRVDYTVIAMVVADMALKPTGDDVWTLLAMAAVIALVAATVVRDLRAPAPAAAR
jgi:uncharacterized membrane protein